MSDDLYLCKGKDKNPAFLLRQNMLVWVTALSLATKAVSNRLI